MLEVSGLHAHYGSSHVLHGVDLRVNQGEVVCLLGRNGAGKTTTVSSIMGFVGATRGQIRFRGEDLARYPVEKRARAGLALVPQGRRVFPLLTVEENLQIGQRPVAGGWDLTRVYDIFPRLRERRRNAGSNLSGGEQQMLAFGRALMTNPALLLMDEPSEGLSPLIIVEMYHVIAKLATAGMSILLVEHSLEQAITMATRIYIMNKGQIVYDTEDPGQLDHETRHRLLGVGQE